MNIFRKFAFGALPIIALLFANQAIHAQIGTYKRLEVGLALGGTQNTGDLNNSPSLGNTRLGLEGQFRYNFNTYFAGRAFISTGSLAGSSKNSDIPNGISNYSFKSNYYNFGGLLEYNFFNFRGIREAYNFSPYLFAGIGATNITIRKYSGDQEITSEGSGISPMIPFGIGVKKAMTRRLNLALEVQTIKLFLDTVDGIETDPDTGKNYPGNIGVNPKKDMAYFVNVSLSYRFITIKCPESSSDYTGDR